MAEQEVAVMSLLAAPFQIFHFIISLTSVEMKLGPSV